MVAPPIRNHRATIAFRAHDGCPQPSQDPQKTKAQPSATAAQPPRNHRGATIATPLYKGVA